MRTANAARTLIVITSVLVARSTAAADGTPDAAAARAAAQVLFDEAFTLLDAGHIPEACEKFAQSLAIDHAGGTLLDLALCREQEGKLSTAWTLFRDAAGAAVRDGRADREATARKHAADLQPRLGRLIVESGSTATDISIDGHSLAREAWNVAVPLDAGHHTLEARAPGYEPWIGSVETVDGATASIRIGALVRIFVPPPPPPPRLPPTWPKTVSWIGVAAGGVALVVGGSFGVAAIVDKGIVESECKENVCTDRGFDAQERGRFAAGMSTGFLIGGGALVVAAIVGLVLAPRVGRPAVSAAGLSWKF